MFNYTNPWAMQPPSVVGQPAIVPSIAPVQPYVPMAPAAPAPMPPQMTAPVPAPPPQAFPAQDIQRQIIAHNLAASMAWADRSKLHGGGGGGGGNINQLLQAAQSNGADPHDAEAEQQQNDQEIDAQADMDAGTAMSDERLKNNIDRVGIDRDFRRFFDSIGGNVAVQRKGLGKAYDEHTLAGRAMRRG